MQQRRVAAATCGSSNWGALWQEDTTHQSHRTATKYKHVKAQVACNVRGGEGMVGYPSDSCNSLWAMAKSALLDRQVQSSVLARKTRQIGIGSCLNVSRTFRDSFTRFPSSTLLPRPLPSLTLSLYQLETPSNWPGQTMRQPSDATCGKVCALI